MSNIKDLKRYSSQWWAYIFTCIIWGSYILQFLRGLIMRLPIIGQFPDTISALIIIIPLICSLSFFLNNLKRNDFAFVIFVYIVYLVNYLIFPQNEIPLRDHAFSFLCLVLPWYLVGKLFDIEDFYKSFFVISMVVVIMTAYYYLFFFKGVSSNELENYNMDASYKLLPHALMTLWVCMKKPSFLNLIPALIGLFMVISFGTRGPLVCCVSFILLYLLFFKEYKHPKIVKSVLIGVGVGFYTFLNQVLLILQGALISLNMSTRIFDKYFSGDLEISEGRDYITEKLCEVMERDGNSLGHGICGSWAYVDVYPHHLILDFWFTFGYIIGSILLLCLFVVIIKATLKSYSIQKEFILLLFCTTIVKLFMSGTYLDDALLFFLIGYGLRIIKNGKTIKA